MALTRMVNGKPEEIPANEAAAIQAEWDAVVVPTQFLVELIIGNGASATLMDSKIMDNLTAGQVTALEAAGYTVAEL